MNAPDSNSLPAYADLAAVLARGGMVQSPAELHGLALGLLVGRAPQPLEVWQREVYADLDPADVLAGECRAALDRLFAGVLASGRGSQLQLALLLPEELVVDSDRLGALRDWCAGYLYGFALGAPGIADRLPVQGSEFLRDIAEFTRIDTQATDDSAADRAALIEIEEYLRIGVMLMYDDLADRRGADEPE